MTKSLVFEWRRRRRFDLRRPFVGIFLHKNCVVIGWRLACVGRRFVVVLFGTVLYRPRTILLFWQLRLKQVSFWNCFVSRLLSWRLQSTCWIWAWNFWRRLHPCCPRAVFPPNFIANWLSVPFFQSPMLPLCSFLLLTPSPTPLWSLAPLLHPAHPDPVNPIPSQRGWCGFLWRYWWFVFR